MENKENCKHEWYQIESDELGRPITYKCIKCLMIFRIKSSKNLEIWKKDYFNTINSLTNKIAENTQKIEIIKLNPFSINEKINLLILEKENVQLYKILKQYKVI